MSSKPTDLGALAPKALVEGSQAARLNRMAP